MCNSKAVPSSSRKEVELLLVKFAERLAELGTLESMPKMEGKRMLAMFAPKGQEKVLTQIRVYDQLLTELLIWILNIFDYDLSVTCLLLPETVKWGR